MGCGDGFYTRRFWDLGKPKALSAVDAAPAAVEVARKRSEGRPIRFQVADAHRLPFANDSFDVALVQSILHHDDRPADLIREAFRVAPTILVHEPNGNNAGLKVIEKLSRYHREHGEKSYSSPRIRRWIRQADGEVHWEKFAGFVPMFAPDWLARCMKATEPLLERCPGARALGCALYVLVARRMSAAPAGETRHGDRARRVLTRFLRAKGSQTTGTAATRCLHSAQSHSMLVERFG